MNDSVELDKDERPIYCTHCGKKLAFKKEKGSEFSRWDAYTGDEFKYFTLNCPDYSWGNAHDTFYGYGESK